MKKINFVIPKGHLGEHTFGLLKDSGYTITRNPRGYRPVINDKDISLKILRPQEIPVFVDEGLHDLGITGLDWVLETESNVKILLTLDYANVKIIMAVSKSIASINSLSDLIQFHYDKKQELSISTEYLNITRKALVKNPVYKKLYGDKDPLIVTPWWKTGENSKVKILLSFGATEAKPPEDADAIVEVIETGTSLEQNSLKVIEDLHDSTAVLIVNSDSLNDAEKREKIYDVLTLLRGVVDAKKKLHIFLNVFEDNLNPLFNSLPALKSPTISKLEKEGWFSINTIIDESLFLEIIPVLRKLAQGLVVHKPRQVLLLEENSVLNHMEDSS